MSTRPKHEADAVIPVPNIGEFAAKLHSLRDMQLPERAGGGQDLEAILRAHGAWVESLADPRAAIAGRRACLAGCDLRGVDLSKRDLRGADLSGANLEGAVLQAAKLTMAKLEGANLRGADLRGATLRMADLSGACLEGADMSGAVTE